MEVYEAILASEGIDTCACVDFAACRVQKPHLLHFEPRCAVIFAVPYLTEAPRQHRVSLYSSSEDYHLFFSALYERCLPRLREAYPEYEWQGFVDHSPIYEVDAAARAGIGIMGDNHLLITRKYGSFVFLGEFLTDAPLACSALHEVQTCRHCGACRRCCPNTERCLSAVTQKKGVLSDEDRAYILKWKSAWGCDICQLVCPENKGAALSPISFFYENRLPDPTSDDIRNMTDEQFSRRAFAWRGRQTILRNLDLLEAAEAEEQAQD